MELLNLLNNIKNKDGYTQKQKNIAEYIFNNYVRLCYLPLSEVCEECGCSEVTFLNFCKKIGYKNYIDLKNTFREYVESETKRINYKKRMYKGSMLENEFFKNVLSSEANYINKLFDSLKVEEIIAISKKIISSKYIVIIGHDWSNNIGLFLKERLSSLNLSPILINPANFISTEYIIDSITDDDFVVFFSFPEYFYGTKEVGKRIYSKTKNILLVTDSNNSPSFKYSKYRIICETHSEIFNNEWVAPLSFVDILTNMIAIILNSNDIEGN